MLGFIAKSMNRTYVGQEFKISIKGTTTMLLCARCHRQGTLDWLWRVIYQVGYAVSKWKFKEYQESCLLPHHTLSSPPHNTWGGKVVSSFSILPPPPTPPIVGKQFHPLSSHSLLAPSPNTRGERVVSFCNASNLMNSNVITRYVKTRAR